MALTIPPDLQPWFFGMLGIAIVVACVFVYVDGRR